MSEEKESRATVKILIAEDEMIVAEDLALTLQDMGYQVVGTASTGELAVQMAQESKPALILMDIKLGGDIDGIEASDEIRTRFAIPVVFLTAYDEKDVLLRAKKAEPYGYLAKPFSDQMLKITTETALYKHAADKRVRASEEKYRLLAENANVGMFTTSLDGAFLQANPAVARMAGYENLEEFLAVRAEQLYSNAVDRQPFLKGLLENDSVKDFEILAQKKDGTPQWVSLNAVIQKDHVGNPASILGIVEDITERKQANEALRESEERYRSLFDNMLEGFAYCKMIYEDGRPQDFVYLHVNAAFERLTDLKNVAGKRVTEVIPGISESNPELFEIYGRVALEGNPEKFETYIASLGIWLCISVYSTKREYFIAVFENITERKQAEEALRESEERYRTVADFTYDWEYWIDPNNRLRYVSPSCERITGYPAQEFLDDPALMERIIHPEDREHMKKHFHGARRVHHESSYALDFRIIHRDGETRWINHACRPVHGQDGQPLGRRASNRDITERKRAEFAHERLATAVEQAAEAIVVADTTGEIQYVNPAFERITGYTREEAIGQNPRLLRSGEHAPTFYKNLWETIKRGGVWTGRFINKKKDGKLYHEDATISPVRDSGGKIVNFVAVKRDITEHLQLSQQLLQAQKMEAIGTLAGGVAHDFNNILQVALGYSELILSDKHLPVPYRADLEKIHQASRGGADLVHRLLTFSRKTEIKPRPMNLNKRIEPLRNMLSRIIPKMVQIVLALADELAAINADPTQMEQILMNLAVNARDAMPEGGRLTIQTENVILDEHFAKTHLEAKPGRYVLLSVSDTGKGMDQETVQHIFEPFFTTKGPGEGTGLGLAMVYGIVKQHGKVTLYVILDFASG